MAFARIDKNNRVIEWSNDQLDGMVVEFGNGDYIDANCVNGVQDFVIRDGQAVYEPTEWSLAQMALVAAEERRTMIINAICESVTVPEAPADKVGFITTPHYDHEGNSIVWTFEPDPNYTSDADGSYLKPYAYVAGMDVLEGKFYEKDGLILMAVASGRSDTFGDAFFEQLG